MDARRQNVGFTLIELIIVITLTGIVGVMIASILSKQMYGYVALNDRAELVQLAELAIEGMARDIRNSIPNSLRVNGGAIEMVPIVYAARYRSELSDAVDDDALDFTSVDTSFDVFADLVSSNTSLSSGQVVIYNMGLTSGGNPVDGANIYASADSDGRHVISDTGITIANDANEDQVQLSSGLQFRFTSPQQRMYIVNGAQSYICNTSDNTLKRFSGYSLQTSQPSSPGGTEALILNNVSACSFNYSAGSLSRNGVMTISLTLTDGDQSIRLLQQVHVSNAP
ncbi:MAG: type II secretion system GspH family protein [Pseudomonadales bacterium]|nr:type II secretion system GspH family protein [Pseudomonadales bacterium]